MTELTDAELLTEAAHLIDTYGWRQGANGNRDDGFCAAGALLAALGVPPGEGPLNYPRQVERWNHLCDMAHNKLAKTPGAFSQMGGLATWNDRPYRKKTEVITFLRELAEEAA